MINRLSSLENLTHQYDCFIFDIYGVIYDGDKLINKIIEFIHHLRENKKSIALLSNSQRQSVQVLEELNSHGFDLLHGEEIFTSGEYFRKFLASNPDFSNKNLFYHLGSSQNIATSNLKLTDNLDAATGLILTFSTIDESQTGSCDEELKLAVKNKCKLICINPDITAPYGDKMMYTPGYFARRYEELGGEVMYFGKPHTAIYDFFIDKFLKEQGSSKAKTIAIGDSISTDIKGAEDFGIDSLLVFSPKRKIQSSFNNQGQSLPTYEFEV
jgi:HAD superfamily hydrolase (TIGR01459 family)